MRVSCIMATHNRRRFVPEAVACFLAQTLTDSELIVVDDGDDRVRDLVPESDRVRYIPVAGRYHFCQLRDIGMRFVQGRYIAVWDDDDLSHPERLAVQVEELERSGKGLCLLASSIVTQDDPPGRWVYTPREPWPLDNSAVFAASYNFSFHVDNSSYSALRALRSTFADNIVQVHNRPELLVTRRHDSNTCGRPCGRSSDWRATN